MKKIFQSHSEVCHIWAQQCQNEGRASNIFFEGKIIYSYGYHYKMAMFHGSTVLINSSGYSVSTAKHTGHVRDAVSHYATIDCPFVDPKDSNDHSKNIEYFTDTIAIHKKNAIRARKHGAFHVQRAQDTAKDCNAYIDLFNLKLPKVNIDGLFNTQARQRIEAQVKEETARQKKIAKQRALKLKSDFVNWAHGADVDTWSFRALPVALRVKDRRVETSHGASVSIESAFMLAGILKASGNVEGLKLDETYTVRSFDGEKLVIGCHNIPAQEVNRMIGLLSFIADKEKAAQ